MILPPCPRRSSRDLLYSPSRLFYQPRTKSPDIICMFILHVNNKFAWPCSRFPILPSWPSLALVLVLGKWLGLGAEYGKSSARYIAAKSNIMYGWNVRELFEERRGVGHVVGLVDLVDLRLKTLNRAKYISTVAPPQLCILHGHSAWHDGWPRWRDDHVYCAVDVRRSVGRWCLADAAQLSNSQGGLWRAVSCTLSLIHI